MRSAQSWEGRTWLRLCAEGCWGLLGVGLLGQGRWRGRLLAHRLLLLLLLSSGRRLDSRGRGLPSSRGLGRLMLLLGALRLLLLLRGPTGDRRGAAATTGDRRGAAATTGDRRGAAATTGDRRGAAATTGDRRGAAATTRLLLLQRRLVVVGQAHAWAGAWRQADGRLHGVHEGHLGSAPACCSAWSQWVRHSVPWEAGAWGREACAGACPAGRTLQQERGGLSVHVTLCRGACHLQAARQAAAS